MQSGGYKNISQNGMDESSDDMEYPRAGYQKDNPEVKLEGEDLKSYAESDEFEESDDFFDDSDDDQ